MTSTQIVQTLVQMAPPQGAEGGQNPLAGFVPIILIFIIFYFLLIRPQQKKMKEHQTMLGNLQRGDDVVTSGGVYGKVSAIADDVVTVQISDNPNVKIKIQKSSIQAVVGGAAEQGK